jgi:polyhydroxyalkanoate synthesis regulator phasin
MMSREEIPWNRVAQEIIRTLGVETARGLYYALMSQSVYPAIARLIQNVASGGARSDEATRAAIQEIQRLLQQQQAALPSQPPSDPQQLQIALAQALQRSYPQIQPSGLPPTPSAYPPARLSPELEERVRSLEREVETLENVRQELLRKYYATFDENERKQVEQRLREVEDRLRERRGDLALLKSQIQAYR